MELQTKRNRILQLLLFIGLLVFLTFSFKLIALIKPTAIRLTVNCLANLLLGVVALLFIKLSGMKADYGFRNQKAYWIGIAIALILQLCIGVIPALLGQSLVGSHTDFALADFIFQFFYYVLIIGPVEELIFRVYMQDTIIGLLPNCRWLGVLIASVLFGFWHLINGNMVQVLFTSIIGCVFGFSKYFIKDCKYTGVAVAHGLYDFLNIVTRILFVQ